MIGINGCLVVLGVAMMAASADWPGRRGVRTVRPRSFAGARRRRVLRIELDPSVAVKTRLTIAGLGLAGAVLAAALMAVSLAGAR